MTKVDRWLLPEGIEEILPSQAHRVESLRRTLLDTYNAWGYDLVIPPLVEFTDSLLSGSGKDLDLLTFKLTDQLSGRMMGVRADITPQTARMDAHSLRRSGVNRLCYASSVLYTRPRTPLASRSPIQVGVELYGEAGLGADLEVISLLIEALQKTGVKELCLDLGHVGIYRSLEEWLGLTSQQEQELHDLLQSKSCELKGWVDANMDDANMAAMVTNLADLCGGPEVIDRAREIFSTGPAEIELALDELQATVDSIVQRYPTIDLYLDLGELEGYYYHTGIVFAAYSQGARHALGNGGRYDDVGETFGRARPATGFSIDLKALVDLLPSESGQQQGIYAPFSEDDRLAGLISKLRMQGERVICGLTEETPDFDELGCDRQIVYENDAFVLKPL